LGFGIWDLGFGIWDLGFGIWDFREHQHKRIIWVDVLLNGIYLKKQKLA
jgi:hypothetical protein